MASPAVGRIAGEIMWKREARRRLWTSGLLSLALASSLEAQAVVERTPNLDDGWTVRPGIIQFDFLHRFEVSPPPARKVTSFPNFHLATGLPYAFNAQLDYATNSTVFTGIPNEYQLGLRRPILETGRGAPLDATLTGVYNVASESVDGEASLSRWVGPVRLLGVVRGISNGYDVQHSMWGLGSGAVIRLTSWLSLAGDVFSLVNKPDGTGGVAAWGAGAQLRIPYSPHSLSIQFTNTQSASIEGSSRGVRGAHMGGFEFTIPFTLSRYFGHRKKAAAAARAQRAPSPGAEGATVIRIANLSFGGTLHVRAGTRVRWLNGDQLQHSVTADDGSFDSGLIDSNKAFEHVFEKPGDYSYHCTPHPFMQGHVIVEP
jgi:plastocyanin